MQDQNTMTISDFIKPLENLVKQKDKFTLGDIVALKSHPYQTKYYEPKIGAYARFTPPVMIVVEILNKTTHDTLTGIKDSNQYKCLFYSTKEGKFEKLWFKGEELKHIDTIENEDYKVDSFSVNEWKKQLIGKEVVLQIVDLELGKKKTFQDTVDGTSKSKVSNLLDYLPPVASILDIKYEEDHIKHSEKNGKITSKKFALQAKIKWLNNESGKFSEDVVPLDCLKLVKFNDNPIPFKDAETYLLPLKNSRVLEDNGELYLKILPLKLNSTTFKHYYYVYDTIDAFSTKRMVYSHLFPVTSHIDFEGLLKAGSDLGDKLSIQAHFVEDNEEAVKDKWFKIWYVDRNGVRTERIVYVQDFSVKPESLTEEEPKPTLRCNCLLRGGLVRNFVVKRIEMCVELPQEFENIFFERVKLAEAK